MSIAKRVMKFAHQLRKLQQNLTLSQALSIAWAKVKQILGITKLDLTELKNSLKNGIVLITAQKLNGEFTQRLATWKETEFKSEKTIIFYSVSDNNEIRSFRNESIISYKKI